MASKAFRTDDDKVVGSDSDRINGMVVNLFKNKESRKLTCMLNIEVTEKPNFLILNAKKAFNYLRLVFIKALIL